MEFDYVIVGGGSGGATLASRLSEDAAVSVCLIEAGGEDSLRVWLTRNQAIFQVGQTSLSSRLIDGQFPNHQQLLPETFEHEVKLPRSELLEVTRRVSQLAQRNAALRLSFSEGELVVSAETLRQLLALALRHRPDRLCLEHRDRCKKPAAASPPPAMLAHQQV